VVGDMRLKQILECQLIAKLVYILISCLVQFSGRTYKKRARWRLNLIAKQTNKQTSFLTHNEYGTVLLLYQVCPVKAIEHGIRICENIELLSSRAKRVFATKISSFVKLFNKYHLS
jgi:hypothetical protein